MMRFPSVAAWRVGIMKKFSDKITGEIHEIIYNVEHPAHGSNETIDVHEEIVKKMIAFYGNPNNYTYPDLVKRKEFLLSHRQTGPDIFLHYFIPMYVPLFTLLCTGTFTMFFLLKQIGSTPGAFEKINELSVSGDVIICVLACSIILAFGFAFISSFGGKKCRKYQLIECELSLIEQRLQKYHGDFNQQVEDKLAQQGGSQATNHNSEQNNNTPNNPANPTNP